MRSVSQTRVAVLALAALAGVAFPALADNKKGAWKQVLVQGLESQDSDVRREAIAQVDVDDKEGVKALLKIVAIRELRQMDWHIRAAAIETLGKTKDEKGIEELAKALKSPDPLVREAAVEALGRAQERARKDDLAKLLDDKEPAVRRAAARALGCFVEKDTLDTLVERLEKHDPKKGWRDIVAIVHVLRALTEEKIGPKAADWRAWWDKERGDYRFPREMTAEEKEARAKKKAEQAKAAAEEKKDEPVTTVARGIPVTFRESGASEGIPLLVLHDDTWKPGYFQPYLGSLEDVCRIFYVELPSIQTLEKALKEQGKQLKYNIAIPEYPVEELCDAFDEIRKQYKYEKFALLAHGGSTLIAQRYLSKHSQNLSHVILVGPISGEDAFGIILDKLRSKATSGKDKELERVVDFHFITDTKTRKNMYQPKSDAELEALERKLFSIMFGNPQDPEIAPMWERCKKEKSTSLKKQKEEECLFPPFDTAREAKPPVPLLVFAGEKSLWTSVADMERVQKNYPVSQLVVLKNSSMMPWFEENEAFTSAVKDFFKKYPPKKGK